MDPDYPEVDVLREYRAVQNKFLKKRFFRKPNVPAAREAYRSLAYHCQREELPEYAAMCWTATAKCEKDTGNPVGERACHLKAAKQYISEEIQDHKFGFVSPVKENLNNALHCYEQAKNGYSMNSPMRVCLNLSTASILDQLGIDSLQEEFLQNAADLSKESLQLRLDSLTMKASNHIKNGDLESALETFTEIADIIEGSPKNDARSELLLNSEITRVLILMLLKPPADLLNPKLGQLLDRYTWGTHKDEHFKNIGMSTNLFILMQSLVLACQSSEPYTSLADIEWEFWKYMNNEQKDLLRSLVRLYRK